MLNFWQQLKKPIFCLAPMEQVTDFAFREMFARHSTGSPSSAPQLSLGTPSPSGRRGNDFVLFTEFVNVDGLLHPEGRKKLEVDLKFSEAQRPIVAQLWGRDPEKFFQAAQIVAKLGFDGIDINMGCPQAKEIQVGACAALIREPKLAQEIIAATKKGAGDLPVSVKTRIGYSKPEEMEGWIKTILEMEPAALILHGRTKKEMSKVPAHWDKIREAVEIRDNNNNNNNDNDNDNDNRTLIIGNGDIRTYQEGLERVKETGCDGVMVGRGAFGNPWFFNGADTHADNNADCTRIRLLTMLEHAGLFEQNFKGEKPFVIMRKHFKAYCSGFPGAAELRAKLMETKSLNETKNIVEGYLNIKSTNEHKSTNVY